MTSKIQRKDMACCCLDCSLMRLYCRIGHQRTCVPRQIVSVHPAMDLGSDCTIFFACLHVSSPLSYRTSTLHESLASQRSYSLIYHIQPMQPNAAWSVGGPKMHGTLGRSTAQQLLPRFSSTSRDDPTLSRPANARAERDTKRPAP